jgi:hypothetical protein
MLTCIPEGVEAAGPGQNDANGRQQDHSTNANAQTRDDSQAQNPARDTVRSVLFQTTAGRLLRM